MNAALLELLVCPLTRTPLVWDEQAQELISHAAGLAYPVRDGIPVLLVDEARPIHSSPAFAGEGDHPQGGGGAF